jgi:hypothetical protein
MLRLGAEASTADLNGRGAPDGPLEDGERRCRAGVTDPDGRFRQDIGFLMLFRDGPPGYLPLGSPLDSPQSGECRLKSFKERHYGWRTSLREDAWFIKGKG